MFNLYKIVRICSFQLKTLYEIHIGVPGKAKNIVASRRLKTIFTNPNAIMNGAPLAVPGLDPSPFRNFTDSLILIPIEPPYANLIALTIVLAYVVEPPKIHSFIK